MNKTLLFFLLLSINAFAQNYGTVWHFGNNAGMSFANCTPFLLETGSNSGFEGCSSISDNNGQLLFYTNSDNVWDRQNNIMPNSPLVSSSGTLSQVLIIPRPGNVNRYFVFTTMIQAQASLSLQYHEIDMTLNNGLGDVLNKNNVLSNVTVTEQVAATWHSNGTDIWVMTHEYGTNAFMAFLVTASGVSSTPVISAVGPAHVACISNMNARGQIKFSPDGTKLAFNANGVASNNATNLLALFDFNAATGAVSNPLALPFSRGEFGLSFSPDNSKLYGTTWKAFGFTQNDYDYLYQFDLSSGNPTTIAASRQVIDSTALTTGYGDLKIGPDGRIYVARNSSNYLGVIQNPNLAGSSCNYISNGFLLGAATCRYGLNNYIEYQNYCTPNGINEMATQEALLFPNPAADEIHILLPAALKGEFTISLMDINGKQVHQQSGRNESDVLIRCDALPAGMYFYRIEAEHRVRFSGKLIVN